MRYFIDTEFIEDGRTIDLISIGFVREDGETLYLQNRECDFRRANEFVRGHVLPHLRAYDERHGPDLNAPSTPWATRQEIAAAVRRFVLAEEGTPEFWGYYSAYDWVVLCQLFGPMTDLPEGWPMYCRDLQQWADALGVSRDELPPSGDDEHDSLADARWNQRAYAALTRLGEQLRMPGPAERSGAER